MSRTKRAIEKLAIIISEAIYFECFDMPDCMESTIEDVEADAMNALTSGHVDYLLDYMQSMIDEMFDPSQPDRFKLTLFAIEQLQEFMN